MNIQVYATEIALIEPNGRDSLNVHLNGVDPYQIIQELSPRDVLDALDFSDIKEYVIEVDSQRESDDYDARTAHIQ